MGKNDQLLIDGIIDERVSIRLPSDDRGEAFEYLACEQILKDFALSSEEINYGSVDGRQDGGIDAFYVFVNGHLLQEPNSFMWPRTNSELQLVIISCKHHDTFKQATLDAAIATLSELLNFALDDPELTGAYSDILIEKRNTLRFAVRKLSPQVPKISVSIHYASRGDTSKIGDEVKARGQQLSSMVKDFFGPCNSIFSFTGATELIELYRKIPNYTLELPIVASLSRGGKRYVVLARLSDYYTFISEDGKLRRHLFESNVRAFMGLNRVNQDIKSTLDNPESPDFWWLNNGVTILASHATITGDYLLANDIQIVNGLQTTESIYKHFKTTNSDNDDRCVLVKVIVTDDEAISDEIIRATNNQTDVELASLHATDKIQRDIEDVLLAHGLYYERRKNHYANQGHKPSELVTPLYAAAAYVALVIKSPHKSVSLKSRFMQNPKSYDIVFNSNTSLEVWPAIVHILKKVDIALESIRPKGNTERFLKNWRYIIAFILVAKECGHFYFSHNELISFDLSHISTESVYEIWSRLDKRPTNSWKGYKALLSACEEMAYLHDIKGIQAVNALPFPVSHLRDGVTHPARLTEEFLNEVKKLLPDQPWKPGLHKDITAKLQCSNSKYYAATKELIDRGFFCQQVDGVLYDTEGNVVDFDKERVDPETLELLR